MQSVALRGAHGPGRVETSGAMLRLISEGLRADGRNYHAKAILRRYYTSDFERMAARKRAFDVAMASVLLLLCLPLLLAVVAAIRLESPGPVLFRQKRYGKDGTVFEILKLRTMYCDIGDPTGRARTVRHDRRVTRVGRLLRRWSLDELVQLVNVLRGEMSLVGPRPHAVDMEVEGTRYDELCPDYHLRHLVRPGLTGWAQVNGSRGEVAMRDQGVRRLNLDLYYVSACDLWFDAVILLSTVRAVLFDENAY